MRYTALILLVASFGSLGLCAPPSLHNGDSLRTRGEDRTNVTEAVPAAKADPKEEDLDDVFVYQWRR
ncbi:hypothetical protein F5B22DRAFT_606209 [Xylaria bambusicola]|uniref:uncharacterized protein n=1 Tax=Xylaria bambusicola TaxID=326684 RepID=UPI002008E4BC|nr:uncharacterized protein F5B22DRAFT_606209 [Xylaria bambusicola]KAI0516715.1 hypothetical protein F5B22DRAFT_606209 [Xylaria bambusicola]